MQLLEDGLVAALASIGLMTLIFLLATALTRPRRHALCAFAVVPCRDGAEEAEETVRVLTRLRCESGCFGRILLLDRGLSPEGRAVTAILCREYGGVTLCDGATLDALLERTL